MVSHYLGNRQENLSSKSVWVTRPWSICGRWASLNTQSTISHDYSSQTWEMNLQPRLGGSGVEGQTAPETYQVSKPQAKIKDILYQDAEMIISDHFTKFSLVFKFYLLQETPEGKGFTVEEDQTPHLNWLVPIPPILLLYSSPVPAFFSLPEHMGSRQALCSLCATVSKQHSIHFVQLKNHAGKHTSLNSKLNILKGHNIKLVALRVNYPGGLA